MQRLRLAHLLIAAAIVAAAIVALRFIRPDARAATASPGSGLLAPTHEIVRQASDLSTDRKLIRTGTLSVQVDRYTDEADRAVRIAESHGGYLAGATASREAGDRQRGTLTLSVEARFFDASFAELKTLGRVQAASVESRDATGEGTDLEMRLSVKRDAQARMREILRTKTGSLQDVVEAERELWRLVEETERLEGERRSLASQVELASITVELFEPPALLREGAAAPLFEALRDALPLLTRSAAMMLYAAAAALPWVLVATLVWKLRKRSRVRRLIRVAGVEG